MEELHKEKETISGMFDSIAGHYDFLNHFLSAGIDRCWRKKLVERSYCLSPSSILDVATGTGDLAIALAKKNRSAKIWGADFSKEMLAIGRQKVSKAGLEGRIVMEQQDALDMPYDDGSFDVVTVAFGVRNFQDLEKGLNEMHRVLRKGGTLYVLELSMPRNPMMAWAYKFYFTRLLPFIGRLTSKSEFAYSYLPRSVMQFPSGERFLAVLRKVGYADCSASPLTGGIATLYEARK